jgi:putative ABC transport system substrate-binding protein
MTSIPARLPPGVQLHVLHASADRDLDAVFAAVRTTRSLSGPTYSSLRAWNTWRTIIPSVPAIFSSRKFVTAGGLVSYNLKTAKGSSARSSSSSSSS